MLLSNVLHGGIALLWAAGTRRLLAPRAPELAVALYALSIVLPLLFTVLHLLLPAAMPPERWVVVRVDAWWATLSGAGLPLAALGELLLAGTLLLFVAQEITPLLSARPQFRQRAHDPELERALARVTASFRMAGLWPAAGLRVEIARLEDTRAVATLSGLRRPCILISAALLPRLDPDELDAVIAHELAHALRGGNRLMFALFVARAVQAASPAALIAFRQLLEAQELACDALAARATRAPASLGRALLEVARQRRGEPDSGSPLSRVRTRGRLLAIRTRVRRLLDGRYERPPAASAYLPASLLLSCLLWLVG